jgi:hypothetical protein
MSEGRLRRVGALWKPKPDAKCLGTGELTINGYKQRFIVLRNDRKTGSRQPDYVLMSADQPERDTYERQRPGSEPSHHESDGEYPF